MNELSKNPRKSGYTVEKRKEILERWKNSTLSKGKFCQEEGIAVSTLSEWLNRTGNKPSLPKSANHLSAIRMIDKKESGLTEDEKSMVIEVLLPNQTSLRFKLGFEQLLLFVKEFCHATTTLR